MKKKVLKALKGSIRKWKRIVAGKGVDKGSLNCPLCKIFNNKKYLSEEDCISCPVMKKTGLPYCQGTPYQGSYVTSAARELAFLKSLLPKKERK